MPLKLRGASAVRRRPITNGNGAEAPSSGLPLNGGGSPGGGGGLNGGSSAGGQGSAAPGGSFGDSGGLPVPVTLPRGSDGNRRGGDHNDGASGGTSSGSSASSTVRKSSRLALSNWRVRWRLFAIITVPTVTALVLGVIQNVNAETNYNNYARVQTMARLGGLATTAVAQLEDERDATAGWVSNRTDATLKNQ